MWAPSWTARPGKGLDIVSGNVVDERKVVLAINRKQLKGVMQARMADGNTMNVTAPCGSRRRWCR